MISRNLFWRCVLFVTVAMAASTAGTAVEHGHGRRLSNAGPPPPPPQDAGEELAPAPGTVFLDGPVYEFEAEDFLPMPTLPEPAPEAGTAAEPTFIAPPAEAPAQGGSETASAAAPDSVSAAACLAATTPALLLATLASTLF